MTADDSDDRCKLNQIFNNTHKNMYLNVNNKFMIDVYIFKKIL